MDGNNRWSKKNHINKYTAYKKGADTLIKLSNFIFENTDAKYISAFALSKNNLNRSKNLLITLKKILSEILDKVLEDQISYNFNIRFIGNKKFLSSNVIKKINKLENLKINKNNFLLIYINYSGKDDIQQAALKYHQFRKKNNNKIKFDSFLMTNGVPDPEILIRTGGFYRLSDFLIYQSTFTELFFSKKLWPELNKNDLLKIFIKYKSLERKFGL